MAELETRGRAPASSDPASVNEALTPKDEVRALLDRLPNEVTLEDIQYHLGVVIKIMRSEEQADREGWIPQSEFDRRLAKWLVK